MLTSLNRRVVVPVATPEDAAATTAALRPHVETAAGTVIAVNVIEKAGGAPDKASVEQRERRAMDTFDVLTEGLAETGIAVDTQILYGTDIAATIIDAAHDLDASAIIYTPRGGSRWLKLLTGDVTHNLVSHTNLPIIVLPNQTEVPNA